MQCRRVKVQRFPNYFDSYLVRISQAKGPCIITLERRLGLTEGVNLSGNKTEGVD